MIKIGLKLVDYDITGLNELGMNILFDSNKIGEITCFPTYAKRVKVLETLFC